MLECAFEFYCKDGEQDEKSGRSRHDTTTNGSCRRSSSHRNRVTGEKRAVWSERQWCFALFFFSAQQKLVICNCSKKIFTIGQTAMKRHCGATYRFCSTQRYIHGREVARDRRCDGMVVTGDGEGCIYVCNICNIWMWIFSCCENGKLFEDLNTTFPLMFHCHFHSPPWVTETGEFFWSDLETWFVAILWNVCERLGRYFIVVVYFHQLGKSK